MALNENLLAFEIPFGKEGMKPRRNRLLSHPTDLIEANGVSFEDDNLRKEAGASTFDTTGILGVPVLDGTLNNARKYDSVLLEFVGNNSGVARIGGVGQVYEAAAASATATVTVGLGNEIQVGDLVVASFATQSDTVANNTIADSGGTNVWTRSGSVSAVAGLTSIAWWTIATAALLNGESITVTDSAGAANAKALTIENFQFIASHTGTNQNAGSDTTTTTVQSGAGATFANLTFPKLTFVALATLGPDTDTLTIPTTDVDQQWISAIKKGTTVTAWGVYIINATSPTIVGMCDWHPDSTTQRLITVTDSGKIFKEVSGDTDSICLASGLTQSPTGPIMPFFVKGGVFGASSATRKLFHFNGRDQVRVIAGDAASLGATIIAHPPADWDTAAEPQPVAGTIHQYRLCAFGNTNFPHTLYFSSADDHEDFREASASGTGFHMNCDSSVGDRLYASAHYQGVLHFWKYPRGIFYLDDQDQIPANWVPRTKSEGLGCAPSPYAVCPMDDDVIFMAADGQVHLLSAVNTLGGTRTSSLSRALGLNQWIRDNINVGALDYVCSTWHANKKTATFYAPGTGNVILYALKFDFGQVQDGGTVRFSWSAALATNTAALRQDNTTHVETPILGGGNLVYLGDRTTRLIDSAAYAMTAQTPHHDLSSVSNQAQVYAPNQTMYGAPGMATKRKSFEFLEFVMNVGTGTFDVEVYIDQVLTQTLTFDATKLRQRKKLFVGDGYTISLKIKTVTLDPQINSAIVWFKQGNEDQSR